MTDRRPRAAKAASRKSTTHDVQAAVEGVQVGEVVGDGDKVEFMGSWFKMSDSIGLMPLLQFAFASKQGLDSTDMEGLAALYAMIRDCIDQTRPQKKVNGELVDDGQSEWDRFQRHAIDTKADSEELMAVVQRCIEAITARPSRPPGGSSAGRRTTSQSSKGSSSTAGTRPRPELEGMVSVADLDRST